MKRITTLALSIATVGLSAMAGGLLHNTNQHIAFMRMMARGASHEIDAVYTNPAGLAFMDHDGWTLSLNIQSASQRRDVLTTFDLFPEADHTRLYKGKAEAPVLPSLYGAYKKLAREHSTGALTGKSYGWGGSLIRPEATGFGAIYYVERMVKQQGDKMEGKRIALSGFGNVAWGAAIKATELGAKVVAISGPDGVCEIENGITKEMIDYMLVMRASNRNKVQDMADKFPGQAKFTAGKKSWVVKCDIAMPCAFQNELAEEDAKMLLANGVKYVAEVSNMGCQPAAIAAIQAAKVPFGPGKAVNAGGVATSGLEICQNAEHRNWTAEEVDKNLHTIMNNIYDMCVEHGREADGHINYVKGANIAGFMRVAKAMVAQGII